MLDDFLVRALLAGIGLALVTGPAGCFVVWRHLAYFGETIAHSALLGVVLALVLRVDLVIGIFASACAVTLLMFDLQRRGTLPADTVLGLLAHGGLAVGLVTLAFFPHIRVDLQVGFVGCRFFIRCGNEFRTFFTENGLRKKLRSFERNNSAASVSTS